MPKLVSDLVLPLAAEALVGPSAGWRPSRSARGSAAAAALLRDLAPFFPPPAPSSPRPSPSEGRRRFEALASSAAARILEAASREGPAVVPPWPPQAAARCARAAALLARRFGRGLRLLRGVAAFASVSEEEEGGQGGNGGGPRLSALLPREALREAAFSGVVDRQLLPYVRAAFFAGASAPEAAARAAERTARVVAALPRPWLRPPESPSSAPPPVAALVAEARRAADALLALPSAAEVNRHAAWRLAEALDALEGDGGGGEGEGGRAGRLRALVASSSGSSRATAGEEMELG